MEYRETISLLVEYQDFDTPDGKFRYCVGDPTEVGKMMIENGAAINRVLLCDRSKQEYQYMIDYVNIDDLWNKLSS